MKKTVLFILMLRVGLGTIFSQNPIPNFDFENWTGETPDQPVGWGTANTLHIQLNGVVTKTTAPADAYSGSSAIVLSTVQYSSLGNTWPVAGTAVSGGEITQTYPFTFGGVPYTQRPTNLRGYAKYFPEYGIWPVAISTEIDPETSEPYAYGAGFLDGIAAGDTVGLDISDIRVYLFSWNGSGRDTIARGQFSPSDTTYAEFIVPIFYQAEFSGNPDTVQIILASSKGVELAPGSQLFVDSLAFDFTPGIGGIGVETLSQDPFSLKQNAPNPFSNSTTITFNSTQNETVLFSIVGALGQEVYVRTVAAVSGENTITYTANLEAGIYFYSLSNGEKKSTKKMTITK